MKRSAVLLGLIGGMGLSVRTGVPPMLDYSVLSMPSTTGDGKCRGSVNNPGKRGKFKRRNRKG